MHRTVYTKERKLRDLFNNLTLGSSKPSQFLREMRILLGSNSMSDTTALVGQAQHEYGADPSFTT